MEKQVIVIEKIGKWDSEVEKLQWIMKARLQKSEYPGRKQYEYLNVQDGIAACTDGHRVHIMDLDAAEVRVIPDGNYEVMENKKTRVMLRRAENQEFVDYWRIFSARPKNGHYLTVNDEKTVSKGVTLTNTILELNAATSQAYNAEYVTDALYPGEYKIEAHPCGGSNRDITMAVIGNAEMIAVLMPYRT